MFFKKSQSEKTTGFQPYISQPSGKGKTMETLKRSVVARGYEVRNDKYVEHRECLGW